MLRAHQRVKPERRWTNAMTKSWTRPIWNSDSLVRRIDRCYLIAAGARLPEKRRLHLELARHYRRILGQFHRHAALFDQGLKA